MDLTGTAALVTGGASGLGLATARRLAAAGAAVTIVDLPGSAGADLAAELGRARERSQPSTADAPEVAPPATEATTDPPTSTDPVTPASEAPDR